MGSAESRDCWKRGRYDQTSRPCMRSRMRPRPGRTSPGTCLGFMGCRPVRRERQDDCHMARSCFVWASVKTAEDRRLDEDAGRLKNWKRWGPYLSERQWATVREDYSADNNCWESFPYEHSLSRAYRWGEDGLLGMTDRECRLCFALALWNGKDPHLKEP